MPTATLVEQRNQAVIAFTLLTGARDRAIASFKLKHVDLIQGYVVQDAREVLTKFSKTFTTYFFPVEPEVRRIVEEWVHNLKTKSLWGLDDPLFPTTRVAIGVGRRFEVAGLDRKHWSSAGPIRAIFKAAFEAAGLPYFKPHSFRKTLAQLGQRLCRTPEEFKAWSQNLGHEQVLTTFSSYGQVAATRQAEIIRTLGTPLRTEGAALAEIAQIVQSASRSASGQSGTS
jgi:integrase